MIDSFLDGFGKIGDWWQGSNLQELYRNFFRSRRGSPEEEANFVRDSRELEFKVFVPPLLLAVCLAVIFWPQDMWYLNADPAQLVHRWRFLIVLNLCLIVLGLSFLDFVRKYFTPVFTFLTSTALIGLGYLLGELISPEDPTLRKTLLFSWSYFFPVLTLFAISFRFYQRLFFIIYGVVCSYVGFFVLHPDNVVYSYFNNPTIYPAEMEFTFVEASGLVHLFIIVFALICGHFIRNLYRRSYFLARDLEETNELAGNLQDELQTVESKHETAQDLLLDILPEQVATRLRNQERRIADGFDEVTVMFADIVDFTPLADDLTPSSVVMLLDDIMSSFDRIIEYYDVEKIKTVGDEYFVTAGVPEQIDDHAAVAAKLAHQLIDEAGKYQRPNGERFSLRIGMHTGPVVAGVIGSDKFLYDVWGGTVNLGSRMESQGVPGRVQVTPATKEAIEKQDTHDRFEFERRGKIDVKGGGTLETFFVETKISKTAGGR